MSAEWTTVDETDEDDIAETYTRHDVEEGIAAIRGLLIGAAVALIPWALLAAVIVIWIRWAS